MKNYLCKDCRYNNNGWCNKHSFNGLKKVTDCEDYKVDDYTLEYNNEGVSNVATKKVIKKNTTVKKKVGKEPEQVLQEGEPIPPRFSTANQVGLNVGVTINLGDFQSLRIDCWISEEVKEGDNRQEIFNSLVKEIRDNIDYVSEEFTADDE